MPIRPMLLAVLALAALLAPPAQAAPKTSFRIRLSDAEERMILHDNAVAFYQLKG